MIGGGPAGMMAAGWAGSRGCKVMLVEKNTEVGRKLLLTGKGRCNITSAQDIQGLIKNIPTNGSFLYGAFHRLSSRDLMGFFEDLGLKLKIERGKRVFPASDRASDVVKVLMSFLIKNEVTILSETVKNVEFGNNGFSVKLKNERIIGDAVIIATGGLSYPATGSTGDGYRFARALGHSIVPAKPALVPIEVNDDWVKELEGLTLKNISISIQDEGEELYSDFGELEFTDYGVRGPVILSASSHLPDASGKRLIIDLKPALSLDMLDQRVQRDFIKYSTKYFRNALGDLLPGKLIEPVVNLSGIPGEKTVNQITKTERARLVHLLKNLQFTLKRYRPIDEAIVTSGGICVDEIDSRTMESRLCPGLFFAGEIIDVDGLTGGFNLQIAFSTGYLAGMQC